jgi:anaerobic magnesium-protoporphyrin IX monomethyl ester cyclase
LESFLITQGASDRSRRASIDIGGVPRKRLRESIRPNPHFMHPTMVSCASNPPSRPGPAAAEILLLETPFVSQTGTDEVRAYVQSKYNLALLALGSYLRAHSDLNVRLINMVKDRLDEAQLIERLQVSPPSVVGVPLYSYNLSESCRIIARIKSEFPRTHVCVGGPHVGMFPAETIQLPYIDSMVLGDGEEPFLQICRRVAEAGGPDALDRLRLADLPPGTVTKTSHAAGFPVKPWAVEDLDVLPTPDLSLLGDHRRYRDFLSDRVMAILTTSRGCPYKCHYCSSESSKYRSFSIGRVIEIMRHYVSQGVEYIEFWDETFNPNKRRLAEFADALLESGLTVPWAIRGSVVLHVPEETIRKLKKTGLRVMQFGVETSQPRLIEYLSKRIDQPTIQQAFESCRRAGVRTVANLMVNIPGSTRVEMAADLEFLKRIRPTYVSISVYNWAPGTTHYREALRTGLLHHDHWRSYAADPSGEEPVLHARTEVPIEEVYRIRDEFVWRYYFNVTNVLNYLRLMEAREIRRAAGIAWMMFRSRARDVAARLVCRLRGRGASSQNVPQVAGSERRDVGRVSSPGLNCELPEPRRRLAEGLPDASRVLLPSSAKVVGGRVQ